MYKHLLLSMLVFISAPDSVVKKDLDVMSVEPLSEDTNDTKSRMMAIVEKLLYCKDLRAINVQSPHAIWCAKWNRAVLAILVPVLLFAVTGTGLYFLIAHLTEKNNNGMTHADQALCYFINGYDTVKLFQCYAGNRTDIMSANAMCNAMELSFMHTNSVSVCNQSNYLCYNETGLCYNLTMMPDKTCVVEESNALLCDNAVIVNSSRYNSSRAIMLDTPVHNIVSKPWFCMGYYPQTSQVMFLCTDAIGVRPAAIAEQVGDLILSIPGTELKELIPDYSGDISLYGLKKNGYNFTNFSDDASTDKQFGLITTDSVACIITSFMDSNLNPSSFVWPIATGIKVLIKWLNPDVSTGDDREYFQLMPYYNASGDYSASYDVKGNDSVVKYQNPPVACMRVGNISFICSIDPLSEVTYINSWLNFSKL